MRPLAAVARQTFLEAVRQPAFVVVLWVTVLVLGFSTRLPLFGLREDYLLLREIDLSTLLLTGTVLGVLAASSALSGEIERGTALVVLSKPVGRAGFVLAKYAGALGAVAVAFWILGFTYVMATRIPPQTARMYLFDTPALVAIAAAAVASLALGGIANYFFARPFPTVAAGAAAVAFPAACGLLAFVGPQWDLRAGSLEPSAGMLGAMGLVLLAVGVLVAAATALSARFPGGVALGGTALVFVGGLAAHSILGAGPPNAAASLILLATPDLQAFWAGDLLYLEDAWIPASYLAAAAGYAALLASAFLAVGIALFRGRDLGGAV